MRLKFLACVLVVTSTLITACETMTSSKRVSVNTGDTWALLPIENLSSTPLAGDRAQALIETHLRARGVSNLGIYQASSEQSLLSLLDEAGQLAAAKQWARDNGYRFAVTGNVQEWQYKNGLDNEPSIGITLKFIDLYSDDVMWVASASRTGWGYSNLSSVASKTIREILSEVKFKRRKSSAPVAVNPVAKVNPGTAQPLPPAAPMASARRIQPLAPTPAAPSTEEPSIDAAKPKKPNVLATPPPIPSEITIKDKSSQ